MLEATRVVCAGSDAVGADSVPTGAVAGADVVGGGAEDFGGPALRHRFRLGPPTNLNSRGGGAAAIVVSGDFGGVLGRGCLEWGIVTR